MKQLKPNLYHWSPTVERYFPQQWVFSVLMFVGGVKLFTTRRGITWQIFFYNSNLLKHRSHRCVLRSKLLRFKQSKNTAYLMARPSVLHKRTSVKWNELYCRFFTFIYCKIVFVAGNIFFCRGAMHPLAGGEARPEPGLESRCNIWSLVVRLRRCLNTTIVSYIDAGKRPIEDKLKRDLEVF